MSAGRFNYSFGILDELLRLWHLLYNKTLIHWDLGKTVCFVGPRPPLLPSASVVSGPQNTVYRSRSQWITDKYYIMGCFSSTVVSSCTLHLEDRGSRSVDSCNMLLFDHVSAWVVRGKVSTFYFELMICGLVFLLLIRRYGNKITLESIHKKHT
jgi:hypothetical protein